MIEDIQIKDLGVIQDAQLHFHSGLTVLTGETGAGKTMVLTALGLLLGERSDAGTVRSGAMQASVTGSWMLPDHHIALTTAEQAGAFLDENSLLLTRNVSSDGRSKAFAGGRQVPVGLLNEIGQQLVVVHGQSEQIRLKSTTAQREALDRFAGVDHLEVLTNYTKSFQAWQLAQRRLSDAKSGTENLEREKSMLEDAVDYLTKLDPKTNEDVELQELAARLTHTEQLRTAVSLAHDALLTDSFESADAIGQIGVARKALESAAGVDQSLQEKADNLKLISQQINEVVIELSSYLTEIESENGMSLDEIQERRSELGIAMKRYGPSLDEVLDYLSTAKTRLNEIGSGSQSIEELEKEVAATLSEVKSLAEQVSKNRIKAANELELRVTGELKNLAMAGSRMHVVVSGDELTPFGSDSISFLLESYEGAEPRPIGKSASGGELSRIMLALEVVLAESHSAATFIFDEVDAGVGGAAAIEVGKRLAMLAKNAQVIVVTHLAQVAAFADKHLQVVKTSNAGFTSSDVKELQGEDQSTELARMLAGLQDSDSAREHALELLDLAKNF
ncbi:MAG: DNA repair protein RecN [Micrococcales bacterium]|nr:DNA repair protein RecN [Micrococcales bacterium]NBT46201.1 DNA repair protein RecN [Actinomycetota bacterium]NBY43840.1 DNA repair protein RecN [Micrococcales bacterium]